MILSYRFIFDNFIRSQTSHLFLFVLLPKYDFDQQLTFQNSEFSRIESLFKLSEAQFLSNIFLLNSIAPIIYIVIRPEVFLDRSFQN